MTPTESLSSSEDPAYYRASQSPISLGLLDALSELGAWDKTLVIGDRTYSWSEAVRVINTMTEEQQRQTAVKVQQLLGSNYKVTPDWKQVPLS